MNITINQIGIKEWETIQKIAHKTWPNTFGEVMPMEQINYMLELMYTKEALTTQMGKGHTFLMATLLDKNEFDKALGFTSYESHYQSTNHLMIHKLYLLPQIQGVGLGAKFIEKLSAIALENGNKHLRLKVFHKNDKAIGFYKKMGFQKTGTATTDIGKNYIILDNVMVKDL